MEKEVYCVMLFSSCPCGYVDYEEFYDVFSTREKAEKYATVTLGLEEHQFIIRKRVVH